MAGPGVQVLGLDNTTWSDHTDVRPTVLNLAGLKDDYAPDGRVLFEDLDGWAVPAALQKNRGLNMQMAQLYKQINAPVGQFGVATLRASTKALKSGSAADDSTYTQIEAQLASLNSQRDALAAQMKSLLTGAEFNGQPIDQKAAQALIDQAKALLAQVNGF